MFLSTLKCEVEPICFHCTVYHDTRADLDWLDFLMSSIGFSKSVDLNQMQCAYLLLLLL